MKTNLTIASQNSFFLFSRLFSLAVAALLVSVTGSVQGASIGVDLNSSSTVFLGPNDSAGVAPFAQTHYNTVSAFPSNLPLNDNTGAATTARLTSNLGFFRSFGSGAAGPDEILNQNGGSSGTNFPFSVSITNIPYANYIMIVYCLSGSGNVQAITVGSTTFYTSSPNPFSAGYIDNNAATPFIYTQGTSTNSALPSPNSDYVIFTGLTGSSQTLSAATLDASPVSVGGFQIVQVPEPSTYLMVFVGFGFLVCSRTAARRIRSSHL